MADKTLCTVLVAGLIGNEFRNPGDTVELDAKRAKVLVSRNQLAFGRVDIQAEKAVAPPEAETADAPPPAETAEVPPPAETPDSPPEDEKPVRKRAQRKRAAKK